jgi:hypothetical protein
MDCRKFSMPRRLLKRFIAIAMVYHYAQKSLSCHAKLILYHDAGINSPTVALTAANGPLSFTSLLKVSGTLVRLLRSSACCPNFTR